MAWFECTTGASSGNGVALIVTTDAEFAGTNITASNGEDTFTQQCPSSAPYVVTFEDIPTGTYTISAVSGGQTVTKTYVVSDYNFEFHNIPTGSTATPVNVIQTWLHCANIWDKSYTTINQVLADTSTLLALISSNNAADYMARSTNWASSVCANQTAMGYIGNNNYCANKLLANSTWLNAICNSTYMESVLNVKVPTMTSNNTPSGQLIGLAENNHPLYYAFDNNAGTKWITMDKTGVYIQYQFPLVKTIYLIKWVANTDSPHLPPTSMTIKGSNDGVSYTTLATISNITADANEHLFIFNTIGSYNYYKIECSNRTYSGDGHNYVQLSKIQFYGRA